MVYDKAKWHSGGNFPKDVAPENGGTHIGFFLAWAVVHDLVSEDLREDGGEDVLAVKERRMTGRTFLFKHLDGVLSEDDLNEHGNEFARYYYNSYMGQYDRLIRTRLPTAYHAKDIWGNYDAVAKLIDKHYAAWQASQPPLGAG